MIEVAITFRTEVNQLYRAQRQLQRYCAKR